VIAFCPGFVRFSDKPVLFADSLAAVFAD